MSRRSSEYDELYVYAMSRPHFILQHVVDAYAAQTATTDGKPITLTFALVGLHLRVERGLDGRSIQRIHMRMGNNKRPWPAIELPEERGNTVVDDVLDVSPGDARDRAIDAWCRAVWDAYAASHDTIARLVDSYLDP